MSNELSNQVMYLLGNQTFFGKITEQKMLNKTRDNLQYTMFPATWKLIHLEPPSTDVGLEKAKYVIESFQKILLRNMKYFMISNFAGDKKSKLKYHKHHIILKIKINLNEMRYF